jgi:hypothetical protein
MFTTKFDYHSLYGQSTTSKNIRSAISKFRIFKNYGRLVLLPNIFNLISAFGFGDPHYSNLDNMNYTFNGCGDFMFLKTIDDNFQIQTRFSRAAGAGLGTVISAVVLKLEGVYTIQINHNRNGKLVIYLSIYTIYI